MVTPDYSNPLTISTQKRTKGLGTGRIQWRTVTKKNGKQYQQAWYDWQIIEDGKTRGKSAYIPKDLLNKVQTLEATKAPVPEVLMVLKVGNKKRSLQRQSQDMLGGILSDKTFSSEIPPSTNRQSRRRKGQGTGYIYWRTVKRGSKTYQQAYYQYEIYEGGNLLVKSSKYIPKGKLKRVQQLDEQKAPVKDILKLLGIKL